MELGVEAARWVVGRALRPVSGGLLEAWAASSELGTNIESLREELLYAQAMLNNARGRDRGPEIQNPALTELLHKLRDLAYKADDVLDELDYFRIQDELDGTYHTADEHDGGCLRNAALNARHTTRSIAKMLGFSKCSRGTAGHNKEPDEGTRGVPCGGCPCLGLKTPDDEEEEEGARPGPCRAFCWPRGTGRASSTPPTSKQGNQEVTTSDGDEEEDAAPPTNQDGQEVASAYMGSLASGARDIIHTVGKHLQCHSLSPVQDDANANVASTGSRFLCCAHHPNKKPQRERVAQAPKLKFDRVEMSQKMEEIVEQLKPVCAKVSTILNLELLDSNRSIAQGIAASAQCIAASLDTRSSKKQWHTPSSANVMSRPITTSELIEPRIFGRVDETNKVISDITKGEYKGKNLTVLPIVGPGGIGKTTLMQNIYNHKKLRKHFEIKLWVCVSVKFNVDRLTQEIADKLQYVRNDKKNSPEKLVEEKLKSKRFLLVLDDMWDYSNEYEWKRFLNPFAKGQTTGNIILVTTRLPGLAQMVKTIDCWIDLKGLDHTEFKELFIAYAFDDNESANIHSELIKNVGDKIIENLKGSPLAAKTVGRLLRNHLDFGHWTRVLESREWESQCGDHDIMPALKLSFDYLPFHLQQCFTCCALFPEDHKFGREELVHFWIGLDVLHSRGENKSIEDIGSNHLTELVNHGFFKKEEDEDGDTVYVIHDLLHELALKVSAHECLSIYTSNMRSIQIKPSIRHLSINIDDSSVMYRKTFDICKDNFYLLGKKLKVENLHSLMLFGEYQDSFVKTFHCLFSKAKALRVIYISGYGYSIEDLLDNFLELIHLRYLRIGEVSRPPKNISRFYHLRVLDLQGFVDFHDLVGHMGNLLKLRHFLVSDDNIYSSIFDVGKLNSLQELKRFEVRKESQGFELRQIGDLVDLSGSLCIDNLEKVEVKEVDKAKLIHKKRLNNLMLHWDIHRSTKDPACEEQVLEGLKPASNLRDLCIRGHGGTTCPSWLGENFSIQNLESLCLDGVAWKKFPPIGELELVSEGVEKCWSNIRSQGFQNLKRIELVKLAGLKRWVIDSTSKLFSHLQILTIKGCSELVELSVSHSTWSPQERKTWFPKLKELNIDECPKLLSLPPVPWTGAPCSASIVGTDLGFKKLVYEKDYGSVMSLKIVGRDDSDSKFSWMALNFHNLAKLNKFIIVTCPPLQLDHLQMLSSLKTLEVSDLINAFGSVVDGSQTQYQFPVEDIAIRRIGDTGKKLTHVLSHMPKLSKLEIGDCEKITWLGVAEKHTKKDTCSSNREEARIGRPHNSREEDEIAALAVEGLLLLPPQLEEVSIYGCPNLSLCDVLLDDDEEERLARRGGGWLQGLCFLRSLSISGCPSCSPPICRRPPSRRPCKSSIFLTWQAWRR